MYIEILYWLKNYGVFDLLAVLGAQVKIQDLFTYKLERNFVLVSREMQIVHFDRCWICLCSRYQSCGIFNLRVNRTTSICTASEVCLQNEKYSSLRPLALSWFKSNETSGDFEKYEPCLFVWTKFSTVLICCQVLTIGILVFKLVQQQ